MGTVLLTDISSIKEISHELHKVYINLPSNLGKNHDKIRDRIELSLGWLKYALDLKKEEVNSPEIEFKLLTKVEVLLQIRLLIIKLRLLKRTNSINHVIKYLIEVTFYLN